MDFTGFSARRGLFAAVAAASTVGLSGCFDLEQRVGLHRDGSGVYTTQVAAVGLVARGIKNGHDDFDFDDDDTGGVVVRHVTRDGDRAVETSEHRFKDLSDLKLGDETVGVHVKGTNSQGESEANFHRVFRVDHARHRHDDTSVGRDVLETMFDGHTYKFAVWLPGRIEHITPVRVHGHVVQPTVWADGSGHTLVWKMDLADAFLADRLDFDVDFAAKGEFHDAQSRLSEHHAHRHHHHHHDDADDDDDDDGDDI